MGSNCCKGDAAGPARGSSIYTRSRAGASLDDRFTSADDAGGVRLTVTAARTGDSGVYTLQASNAAGAATARARLEVSPDEAPTGEDPPTFLRRLQDLTVKVGTRTRFLVEIVSSTECKVTWFRNERRLLEAERVTLARDGQFWCADVAAVSVDDAGRWTCTAENEGGRASCSAHLNVLVPKAYKRPEFVEELRALLTEQGTVSLECKVVGVPTPVLRWFKDSCEIKAGDVFALTANAEDPTSLGTYTCEAVNCMGRAYSSSKVHVVGRGSREGSAKPTPSGVTLEPPPIFTKEPEDQYVKISQPLSLGCQLVVPPWPRSVVWYNKEGKVEASDRYHVTEDGVGGYLLEAAAAEWPDEGEWKCVATSAGGRVGIATCYVTMDVPKNFRKPRFMENLQAVLTEEGLVSFECKVVGFPTPVLSWFKDGQELKPGDVYQLTGTNSLGSYCCIARNCMGQASSSAELTVEDIQNQLNEEEKLQLFSKNQAPKFLQGLKSVEAKIDEPFRFIIRVAIPPEPSVMWYRDDQPVDDSSRCHHSKEEKGAFNLDIQNLEFLDQAEWKCVAMNDFGHSVTSCFLKLIIPRHYKKPRFLENLQAILSDEGAVNLECKVIGVPQPVLKWYKDGEELKPGDIHRIISGQDGTCCLGTYTCEAQNCMGIAASSASLLGFDDSMKAKKKKAEEQALQRNLSLSTIHEERTSQMYDTPVGDITLDDKGEISFSFDGKEVSVSLYETPDLTEEEALQIVEMYADQLSENVTEHNVVELPPLRFVKETSTSGNLLMEAIIIDVSPDYFASPEEDLRTEADVEDISIADENAAPQLSLDTDLGEDYLEKTMALLSEEKADISKKQERKKSDSVRSGEDFFSFSREQSISEGKRDDDTQVFSESDIPSFASARSSGKIKSKSSKPSDEDGKESSDIMKTVLQKEDAQKYAAEADQVPPVKSKRERRSSRSSRRSSSGSEKSLSRSRDEPRKKDVEQIKPQSMSDEDFRKKMINVSASLTKVINDVQIIERDIILKSELMSSAATASRSLEIISSLITPLSEIHSVADVAKESVLESKEVISTLFNNLPQPLKSLQQSLTIIEKCIDVESDSKTLVKKTCVAVIETCGNDLQKLMTEINSVATKDYLLTDQKILTEIDLLTTEINTVVKYSDDTIKTKNLLSEASEIKTEESTIETKHLHETQKAIFELRSPLNSLLCIAESADSGKIVDVAKVKNSDVILTDMSASIQDLQAALEQIESLSVKESSTSLHKYNTEIIETVMESILKLRTSFEQLSTETRTEEDQVILKQALSSIKLNLSEISSQIDRIESSTGTFDILQSDNKLDVLQKMAQILIALENNLPRLETISNVKTHMVSFHKHLTKVLENVIESNEAKKYFTLMDICAAVNRLNASIKSIESDSVLSLASLNNTLRIIQDQFVKNVFESELNCNILSNITDVLIGIQEAINNPEENSLHIDSEHYQDFSGRSIEQDKAKLVIEHIEQTIAAISNVKSLETTKDLKVALAPALENICPVLEELKRKVASVRQSGVEKEEHVSSMSSMSDLPMVQALAAPICNLNSNIVVLNQMVIENLDTIKENTEVLATLAEPLHELYTTLEVLQQDVISQYGEDVQSYDVSLNMANAVQSLQSCIVMIQEQAGVEGADDMSTLEDISGIKTNADTIPSERLVLPTAQETSVQQSLEPFEQAFEASATAKELQSLNEHITVLRTPEIIDALDTLSEVSDYSSLKSVALGLGELHTGIEEILHPMVMESPMDDSNFVNTSKLTAIAEPMQELQQSLSVLDINNIPIYEHILEMPTERIHSVLKSITEFKEILNKCIQAVFPAMETADKTIEISNKVESLRDVCEYLKAIIQTTKSNSEIPIKEEVIVLEQTVNNLLDATDVSKGIKIEQVKSITEELYQNIANVQEEIIQFTPTSPKLTEEAKLIQAIDEIENNIAVLEQYEFVDLSKASDITSCTSPQLAMELESESLMQMEDIVENAVNIVQDSAEATPIADLMIIEDFFKICRNQFAILRCLMSKQLSHKKIIRLLQEFVALQNTINEFKLQRSNLTLSNDIDGYLTTFLIHADDCLKTVQSSLVQLVKSQSEVLFKTPLKKLDESEVTLKKVQSETKSVQIKEVLNKFIDIIQSVKPCVEHAETAIEEELKSTFSVSSNIGEQELVTKMEDISIFIENQVSTPTLDSEIKIILEKISSCIQKHEGYKEAIGSGKTLIVLKCLSECSDILQAKVAERQTIATNVEKNVEIKDVLSEMLEPLQVLHSQLEHVQAQILSGIDEDSVSIDITTTESLVQTMTEIHKEIVNKIEANETIVNNEEISLVMELDKEIHSIQDSMRSMENMQVAQVMKEISKPIEDIEKSLHSMLASDKVKESKGKLPPEKAKELIQHIDQYIELIEIVEEISAIIKIEDLSETVNVAKELRESIAASQIIAETEMDDSKWEEINENQTKLAQKLQTAISALQVQVLEGVQEIAPALGSDILQRIARVTSQLQADLVAVTGVQVAVQAPADYIAEITNSIIELQKPVQASQTITANEATVAEGSEPLIYEKVDALEGSFNKDEINEVVLSSEIMKNIAAESEKVLTGEGLQEFNDDIENESVRIMTTEQLIATETLEPTIIDQTKDINEAFPIEAEVVTGITDTMSTVVTTETNLLTELVERGENSNIASEEVKQSTQLTSVSYTAEENCEIIIDNLLLHTEQFTSKEIAETIGELCKVADLPQLAQSVAMANELRDVFAAATAFEATPAEAEDVFPQEVVKAHQLKEALDALQNIALQNPPEFTTEALQSVVDVITHLQNDLTDVIVAAQVVVQKATADIAQEAPITESEKIIVEQDTSQMPSELDQTLTLEQIQITNVEAATNVVESTGIDAKEMIEDVIEDKILVAEKDISQIQPTESAETELAHSLSLEQIQVPNTEGATIVNTDREEEAITVVTHEVLEVSECKDTNESVDVQNAEINVQGQETINQINIDENTEDIRVVLHHIEQFISEESMEFVTQLCVAANVPELALSIVEARELREAIVSMESLGTTVSKNVHTQQIVQLHDTLSTLQQLALQSAVDLLPSIPEDKVKQVVEVITHVQNHLKTILVTSQATSQQGLAEKEMASGQETDIEQIKAKNDDVSIEDSKQLNELIPKDVPEETDIGNLEAQTAITSTELVVKEDAAPTPTQAKTDSQQVSTIESTALVHHIDDFISSQITEVLNELSSLPNAEDLKQSVVIAKELRESIAAVDIHLSSEETVPLSEESRLEQAELAQKLQDALCTLQAQVFDNAQELPPTISPDVLETVSNVVTHLQDDLKIAIVSHIPQDIKPAPSEPSPESTVENLESLLKEVYEKINVPESVKTAEETQELKDRLDEVQTVIIKLKRDCDGAGSDTLNETLEDLECSVRSVQLQVNEDSPRDMLKEACATLVLLANTINENQNIYAEKRVKLNDSSEVLRKCSEDAEITLNLLELASKFETKDCSHLNNIVSNLKALKDTLTLLKINFQSGAEHVIERGVDIIQNLDIIEEKLFALERDVEGEKSLGSAVTDHILTAIHSVYGSISNMRGSITSIQKQYLYENFGKPTENFLRSIKNVSNISKLEDTHSSNWKKLSKSLRNVLNHFEDIKFYVNLDKTARLPSDATFTKIIMEELKFIMNEVLLPRSNEYNTIVNETIQSALKCAESVLVSIESRSELEVKEKIPIFKDISENIFNLTRSILTFMSMDGQEQEDTDSVKDLIDIEKSLTSTEDVLICEPIASTSDEINQIVVDTHISGELPTESVTELSNTSMPSTSNTDSMGEASVVQNKTENLVEKVNEQDAAEQLEHEGKGEVQQLQKDNKEAEKDKKEAEENKYVEEEQLKTQKAITEAYKQNEEERLDSEQNQSEKAKEDEARNKKGEEEHEENGKAEADKQKEEERLGIERELVEKAKQEVDQNKQDEGECSQKEHTRLEQEQKQEKDSLNKEKVEADTSEADRIKEEERLRIEKEQAQKIEQEAQQKKINEEECLLQENNRLEQEQKQEEERINKEKEESENAKVDSDRKKEEERLQNEKVQAEKEEQEAQQKTKDEEERLQKEKSRLEQEQKQEEEHLNREKEESEKAKAEADKKKEEERLQIEKEQAEKIEQEAQQKKKDKKERLKNEKSRQEQEQKEEEERLNTEKVEAEKVKAEADRNKEEERLRIEKEQVEKAEQEANQKTKDEEDRLQKEKSRLEQEQKQEEERRNREKEESEKARAEADKTKEEERLQIEKEQAEKTELEAQQKKKDKKERLKKEKSRLEQKQKEEEERLNTEKEEAEKVKAEADKKKEEELLRIEKEQVEKAEQDAQQKKKEEEERINREKEEAEKAKADSDRKTEEERLRIEKEQAEKAEEQAQQKTKDKKERLQKEKSRLEQEQKQEEERLNREKEDAEKTKAEADKKKEEEQLRIEKEQAEKAELDAQQKKKEEEERLQQENNRREQEQKQEEERLNREKEEAEKAKAEIDRKTEEERLRIEKEQAEKAELEAQQKKKDKKERLQKEKSRLEQEQKQEEERLNREKEEAEKTKAEADKKKEEERLRIEKERVEKAEQEAQQKKIDEEERLQQENNRLEQEQKQKEERLNREKEEAEKAKAEIDREKEEERLRIEKEQAEKAEQEAQQKKKDEEERLRQEKESSAKVKADAEKKKKKKEEKVKKEKEATEKARLEKELKEKEEEVRLNREKEEAEKSKAEADQKKEEERLQIEKEQQRKNEEERLQKEQEQHKKVKQEAEQKKKDEEERLRKDQEIVEKARLEKVQKDNDEEETLKAKAEAERKIEEERLKIEQEQTEKAKLELEEKTEKERERKEKEDSEKAEADRNKKIKEEKVKKEKEVADKAKLEKERKDKEEEDRLNREKEEAEKLKVEADKKKEEQRQKIEKEEAETAKKEADQKKKDEKQRLIKEKEDTEKVKAEAEKKKKKKDEKVKKEKEAADKIKVEEGIKREEAEIANKERELKKIEEQRLIREKDESDKAKQKANQSQKVEEELLQKVEDEDEKIKAILEIKKTERDRLENQQQRTEKSEHYENGKDLQIRRQNKSEYDNVTGNRSFDEKTVNDMDYQKRTEESRSTSYESNEFTMTSDRRKQANKEKPTFVDHSSKDYSLDFARPSGYKERTFDESSVRNVLERESFGRNPVIYKTQTILLDSQLRSSLPPLPDISRSSEREVDRRSENRQRSKAMSEARSVLSEKRSSVPRDIKRKPVFSTYLTDRTAVEGSRVKLTCSVLSSADPSITWYKNGVLIENKLKYRTKVVDGLITLEVLNAVPTDSAEYSCTVENENGSISSSANLKVYPSFEASPIPPTFTRSIRDTYHLAENELVLECRIRGQPLPTISWLKDDREISINDRFQAFYLADGLCRLAIDSPTPADSGKYTCRAENSVWSDQITHAVNFTGKESRLSPNIATIERSRFNRQTMESRRPHFSNVLTDYRVARGGTIGLQVEIRGCPERVEWLREGRSVLDAYRNARTFVEQELYTLALTDVTEKETGMYTCRAWSTHGMVDMNAAITVVHPNEMEGKPAIIVGRPEKDVLISVGEDLNISFRVQGEPKPKVLFMKGIRDITNGQRVCKMTSDDYVKFTLKRSMVSDAGTYCILARNAYGCDRAFVTVVIRQRASSENLISDWTYPLDDASLSIAERRYKSVPDRIPGEPSVVDGGSNWVSIAWPKAEPRDAAPVLAYRVEGWQHGKDGGARWQELGVTPLNSFDVFNLKQGEEYHFRVTPRNRYGWGEAVQTSSPVAVGKAGDTPEFVDILPGQLKVLVGETTSLSCSVKGKPTPEVVWMKNGHEIEEEGRRVTTTFNGYNCSLTIRDIRAEDEARYSCEAANAHGRASTYARLAVVTDRLIWEADAKLKRERSEGSGDCPPQYTMRLRDRRVQATYPVRLTCQVVGRPPPTVTWYKDGDEMRLDNRHISSQDEHFHTLEIAPTSLEDGGMYEAVARNSSGAVNCRCCLVVDKGIRAYVAPDFCCGLEPLYRVQEGDELRISAVVEAYPTVGVTWYRDGVRLRPSRRAIMTLDHDGQTELALASMTCRDAGVYTCTASNEVGRASTSGKVEVSEGDVAVKKRSPPVVRGPDVPYSKEPMFTRKPRSSEAREGDTVIIECEVIGDPKPDVYWLRDFLKPDYYRDANHFKRVGGGPSYRFEIPHAKLDYTGAYSVVARNEHGEAKAIISLQILARDPSSTEEHNVRYGRVEVLPRFERYLTDLLSYDGDTVEFQCLVSGNPEPRVRWFHYTDLIRDNQVFESSFEEGTARLRIKQVAAEDEGTYTCEAANCIGKTSSSACLVVYPPGEPNTLSQRLRRPPTLLSAASTPRSTPRTTPARSISRTRTPGPDARSLCSPSRQMAPKFYTYPFNKVVEEGETVVFQCAVRGHPAPWTSWDKDGAIVTPSGRVTIREKDEMMRILEIEQVSVDDVGLYRITVENEFGRVEASARLEMIAQGKFHAGVRAYSPSPRRAHAFRRRPPSVPRHD